MTHAYFIRNNNRLHLWLYKSSVADDERLACFKRKVLEALKASEKQERRALIKSLLLMLKANYPVGTVRTWGKDKKVEYVKVAPGKWRPHYAGTTRGSKQTMTHLYKRVMACTDAMQLMQIVNEHQSRFRKTVMGADGQLHATGELYDWVHDLHNFAREQRYKILTATNAEVEKRHAEARTKREEEEKARAEAEAKAKTEEEKKKSSGKDPLGYDKYVKGDTLFERHGNEDPDDVTIPRWKDEEEPHTYFARDYFADNIAYSMVDEKTGDANMQAKENIKQDVLQIEKDLRAIAPDVFQVLDNQKCYSAKQVKDARAGLHKAIQDRYAELIEGDSKYTQKPEIMDSASFNRYVKSQYSDEIDAMKHIMYRCIHNSAEHFKTTAQMLNEYENEKVNPSFKYWSGGAVYGLGTYFSAYAPATEYGESMFRSVWKKDAKLLVVENIFGTAYQNLIKAAFRKNSASKEVAQALLWGCGNDVSQTVFAKLAGYDGVVNLSYMVVFNRSATIVDNSMWQETKKGGNIKVYKRVRGTALKGDTMETTVNKSMTGQEENDNIPSTGDAWIDVDIAMARDMARQQEEQRRRYRAEHNLPLDDD